jgi:membrane fusion protein, copper/silver efflux system
MLVCATLRRTALLRGNPAMKKNVVVLMLFSLLAGMLLANIWGSKRAGSAPTAPVSRKVLYYVDPMHPAYKSDKPGIAPDCGMDLVAVYEDGSTRDPEPGRNDSAGAVAISTERQQLIGVRVSTVEKAPGTYKLRLFGRVAADEERMYKLNAGIEGYIQEVSSATTGSQVRKNQLLATFCAPNANMTIQTYLLNLGAEQRFSKAAADRGPEGQSLPAAMSNIQQRTQQLRNLGMSAVQIEEIKRTHQVPESIKIVSPVGGFVLARNVSPDLKFERGAELYRIADLKRVWILADVFEDDAQHIRAGMRAQVTLPGRQKSISTIVSAVLPQFDPATRTLKVRLEIENPNYILRPDMFATVEIPIKFSSAITVPVDAVLDSGLTKTVFIERDKGFFEPRQVETGQRFDERVEIVKGIAAGERIVVSGNFLISSEARLKNVADQTQPGIRKSNHDTGMSKGHVSRDKSTTFSPAAFKDPACGMDLEPGDAKAAGRTSDYDGTTYYFCSDSCKRKFDADPARYLKRTAVDSAAAKAPSQP